MGSYNSKQPVGGQCDTCASLSFLSGGCSRAREPGTGSAKNMPHVCFCAVSPPLTQSYSLTATSCHHDILCHTQPASHTRIVTLTDMHIVVAHTQRHIRTISHAVTHVPLCPFILRSWHIVQRLLCALLVTDSCGYMDQPPGTYSLRGQILTNNLSTQRARQLGRISLRC